MTTPDGNASGATAANYTTNYAYDPAGNLVPGHRAAGGQRRRYAAQTATTTRPVTTYGYDTFGDQTQVRDPDGNVTTTGYDGDGRVTSVTQPSYTPPGSSAAITAPTTYGYDEDGNLTSVTDPNGNITTSTPTTRSATFTSRPTRSFTGQSAPGTWTYTYDSDGEQLSATSPTAGRDPGHLRLLRRPGHLDPGHPLSRAPPTTPPATPTTTWATR